MASLNTSTNGPSIKSSYQSVINDSFGAGSDSPTYGIWAVFSVSAPLINAFQPDRIGKESILKVHNTGQGQLQDMVDEFSEGRIQFAFVKIKDSNTQLPKNVLIGWVSEALRELELELTAPSAARASQKERRDILQAISPQYPKFFMFVCKYRNKFETSLTFQGYHVQITARSDRDLTPESIIKKVADASGAKYNRVGDLPLAPNPPTVISKPAFTPSQISKPSEFNYMAHSRLRTSQNNPIVDEDGWGLDAPQVTRSKLEKVAPAYKPTKVNMAELTKQNSSNTETNGGTQSNDSQIIKGGYQPVGKVDIAAIRAQANGNIDDRPTVVRGAYVPVGKVDIAAIRAKAQRPVGDFPSSTSSHVKLEPNEHSPNTFTLADRSEAFTKSERLTALPKPKVANNFGSTASNFMGTKAPQPFGLTPSSFVPPIVGTASKTFADEGGKTPAQIWQEKKARERGSSITLNETSPQNPRKSSVGSEWKSGYTGKSWAPVSTNPTGRSGTGSISNHLSSDQDQEDRLSPVGGINAIRSQFQGQQPVNISTDTSPTNDQNSLPPSINTFTRPPLPVLPPPSQPTSSMPESPDQEASPPLIAIPVARTKESEMISPQKLDISQSNVPFNSLIDDEHEKLQGNNLEHNTEEYIQPEEVDNPTAPAENVSTRSNGEIALILYDYDIDEDNEIQLVEGEYVTNIDMVDQDWWMGTNSKGETGLFPSNYVELVDHIPDHS